MSLVGQKAAVVSLGMSCQTTLQIDDHADLIAQAVGDPDLKPSSLPFDNLVCHPRAAAKLLESDAFYPASKDELAVYRGAFWTAQQVYFRHECTLRKSRPIEYLRGKVDVARGYRDLAGKFAHLAEKFRRLRELERLIFVVSNSQNDLTEYQAEVGIDCVVPMDDVTALCDACDRYFGRRCEYIFAIYDGRTAGVADRSNLRVFRLTPDLSEWAGDHGQWRAIWTQYFGEHTPPPAARREVPA
jgi:hypothetical protein